MATNGLTEAQLNSAFQIWAIFLTIQILLIVGEYVSNFIMFKRIGENKWLGLIPIMSDYIRFKSFWNVKWFIAYFVCYILYNLESLCVFACNMIGKELDEDFSLFPVPVSLAISLFALFMVIGLCEHIAKAFNKSMWWTFGLAVCYPLFAIILAKSGTPSDELLEKVKENRNKTDSSKETNEEKPKADYTLESFDIK